MDICIPFEPSNTHNHEFHCTHFLKIISLLNAQNFTDMIDELRAKILNILLDNKLRMNKKNLILELSL